MGDNVPVNDVGARYVCEDLDPSGLELQAKEIRGRCALIFQVARIFLTCSSISCFDHTFHLMACHFVKALNIPGLQKARQQVHDTATHDNSEGVNEYDENLIVDVFMETEALPNNAADVLEASITDFEAGDIVGKLMAFLGQLHMCGEDMRDYLKQLQVSNKCPPLEVKLWIRTCWGHLSDCFQTVLTIRKVCIAIPVVVAHRH